MLFFSIFGEIPNAHDELLSLYHTVLYCRDGQINTTKIFDHFTPDRCPSLKGKPKLFFIQACQGGLLDSGTQVKLDASNSNSVSRKTDKPNV